jgi:site-specific DNA recombinase
VAANAKLRAIPAASPVQVRCAIYTRKSTEEGLDQDFNSLDAQRESGEAFILSQKSEGCVTLAKRYDDGGYSGSHMDRPALKELLADVETGKVNCIVVYKVDRLTRNIHDFSKILDVLLKHNVTFVSVTQQFNTTTSIGRLTLNMLLSFAQFERETIAERTRDKMHAARRKGKWIGGNPVLGYDVAPKGGALVVNTEEAKRVREIFRLYLEHGSLIPVVEELDRRGCLMKGWTSRAGRTRGGARFNRTTLYNLLTNVIYTGRVKFEGKLYDGEHERIIDDDLFNRVQEQLHRNGRSGGRTARNKIGGLLRGLVRCATCGAGMIHTYSQKRGTLYRYYVCVNAHQRGWNACQTKSVPAPLLEGAVVENVRRFAQQPEMLSEMLRRIEEQRRESGAATPMTDPADVRDALTRFEPLWDQLTAPEKERCIRALVSEVRYDGPTQMVTVGFRSEGIQQLCETQGANE